MIDRKTAMSWLEGLTDDDWRDYHSDSEVQNIAKETFELLKESVKIIRCKDCKYCEICGNGCNSYCNAGHNIMYTNGFCSEAELKDDQVAVKQSE